MKCYPGKVIYVLFLIAVVTGLGLTIKLLYLNEVVHYHVADCHVNTCSSNSRECCRNTRGNDYCYTCYGINVNYDLYYHNNTDHKYDVNYTKSSYRTVDYSTYCDQHIIPCYYDDRDIFNSLRIDQEYATGSFVIIVFISILLLIVLIFLPVFFEDELNNSFVRAWVQSCCNICSCLGQFGDCEVGNCECEVGNCGSD